MKKFRRRSGVISSQLSGEEVALLQSLVVQLIDLVSEGRPEDFAQQPQTATETDDPFEFWSSDLAVDPDEPETPEDPALRRLFPNPYPHDAAAASDYRRFTERELRTTKISEAKLVLDGLAATQQGALELRIPRDHADAWLRTLTSVRLAVATRLGVTDAQSAQELSQVSESDPRAFMASVYDWLGFAQETLVDAL